MSTAVRVIACLDVNAGRVVKGVNFSGLSDAGDPVELAKRYNDAQIDELTFLDVSASTQNRATLTDVVSSCAEQVFIPLTVGGGVRSVEDVATLLRAGSDKAAVNTAAVNEPDLIDAIAQRFGAQVLVLSLDARRTLPGESTTPSGFEVTTHGGRSGTGRCAVAWAQEAAARGAGEILLNSIDADGTKSGFDTEMIAAVRAATQVPLIASGGAGRASHFPPAVGAGANAVLAASIFHFGEVSVAQVKSALRDAGEHVR